MLLEQTTVYDINAAIAAIRLLNKARQCAKRGDNMGMFNYTQQAYISCATAHYVPWKTVANVLAWNATRSVYTLYILARDGNSAEFVQDTRTLRTSIADVIEAVRWERKHGS